jgi:hypothetical protein
MRYWILLLLVAATGCVGQPAGACEIGSNRCTEWSVVLKSVAETDSAVAWFEAHKWPVRKRLDEMRLLYVWLPKSGTEEAQAEIRAQPWLKLLTDVRAVPND